MGGLDAPGLGIEVVGTIADVLCRAERIAQIGKGDDATRGIGRENKGFASQIAQGIGIGEVDTREIALGQIGLQNL